MSHQSDVNLYYEYDGSNEYGQPELTVYAAQNALLNFLGFHEKIREQICEKGDNRFVTIAVNKYDFNKLSAVQSVNAQGELNGDSMKFYANGSILESATYKNNKLDGDYTTYHARDDGICTMGVTQTRGQYVMGKKIGCWTRKYPDGKIAAQSYYKDDGSEIGFEIGYDNDQKPAAFKALNGNRSVVIFSGIVRTTDDETRTFDTPYDPETTFADQTICALYKDALDFMDEVQTSDAMAAFKENCEPPEFMNRPAVLSPEEKLKQVRENFTQFRTLAPVFIPKNNQIS